MSAQSDLGNLSVRQFADRFRQEMIPLGSTFSYFCAAAPLSEEDVREYLEEPIAALPPKIAATLPKISIFLVPYLKKRKGRERSGVRGQAAEQVSFERPAENRQSWASQEVDGNEAVLAFAVKEQELADYHYRFYRELALLVAKHWAGDAEEAYSALVREEMNAGAHGEVDDDSWRLKQGLARRGPNAARRGGKTFREYLRQSFVDTLTLYLHGICCDIDVETGPRQLASRYLRRRLSLLENLYPPPQGYSVFPDEGRGPESK
jgi:hypothetical protein